MKIAVCFSGQIRTGVVCAPNIIRYIGELASSCDFFVHTWDIETHSQNVYGTRRVGTANTPFLANPNEVCDFYKIYKPIAMVVDSYTKNQYVETINGSRINKITGRRMSAMLESIYECNRLKKDYEQRYQFVYDYVVRIRPDLVFNPTKKLSEDISQLTHDNMILCGEHMTNGQLDKRMEDVFWIARSKLMDDLTEFAHHRSNNTEFDQQNWQDKPPGYLHIQEHLAQYVSTVLNAHAVPLKDNRMKVYWRGDEQAKVDPMTVLGDPRRMVP